MADKNLQQVADAIRAEAELFDIPGQAVIGTMPDGKIDYWNDSATHLYGWSRSEVLGREVVTVTPADMSREAAAAIMRELAAGRTWTGDFRVRHRNGEELYAHVRDVPVRDDSGALIGIVGISAR